MKKKASINPSVAAPTERHDNTYAVKVLKHLRTKLSRNHIIVTYADVAAIDAAILAEEIA